MDAANLDLINKRINDNLNDLILSTSSGVFDDAQENSDKLLFSINRRQAAMGNTSSFSAELSALNAQLQKLNANLTGVKGQINASQSGYFLSKIDGYENILKSDNLSRYTPEYLDKISAEEQNAKVIGKIVSDYEWYIAAKVSINESHNFKVGDTLKIYTSVKSSPVLPVTVKQINTSNDSLDAVIIFSCSEMNSELAAMRSGPMTVVSREYSGLKVAKKALRIVDGQKGVYILKGMQAKFVPVNILYSTDSMMVCEKADADGSLRLYDQVIVKGRNLYDGKIIG